MSELSRFALNAMTVITRIGTVDVNSHTVSKRIWWVSLVNDSVGVGRTWFQVWVFWWSDSYTLFLLTCWNVSFDAFITLWVNGVSNATSDWLLDWDTLTVHRYQTRVTSVSGWYWTSFVGVEFETRFACSAFTILIYTVAVCWNLNTVVVDQSIPSNTWDAESIDVKLRTSGDSRYAFVVENGVTRWTGNTNDSVSGLNSSWTWSSNLICSSTSAIKRVIRKSWITECTAKIFIIVESTISNFFSSQNTDFSSSRSSSINKWISIFTLRATRSSICTWIKRGINFTIINDSWSETDLSFKITWLDCTQPIVCTCTTRRITWRWTWITRTVCLTIFTDKIKILIIVWFLIFTTYTSINNPSIIIDTIS